MTIENPYAAADEERQPDLNYVLVGKPHNKGSSIDVHPVTMTHGASTDQAIAEAKKENELSHTDLHFFEGMFNEQGTYSETYKVLPDGTFDKTARPDGIPPLLGGDVTTPDSLYTYMAEIQEMYPEYRFDFEKDPEGQWMKYTVSKK